jgi:hypothetical protein
MDGVVRRRRHNSGFTNFDARRFIGVALLLHFVAIAVIKFQSGTAAELWWMSHIALLMAGVGLLIRSTLLWTAALTKIGMLHVLWMFDFGVWWTTGWFPLGACGYVVEGGIATWIATLHHFYLLPLLIVLFAKQRQYSLEAPLTATAVFVYLTIVSRALLPPGANVNFAFQVTSATRNPVSMWVNSLPDAAYLPALNAVAVCFFFLPVAALLWRCAKPRTSAATVTL